MDYLIQSKKFSKNTQVVSAQTLEEMKGLKLDINFNILETINPIDIKIPVEIQNFESKKDLKKNKNNLKNDR